jgi:hypothetical protein
MTQELIWHELCACKYNEIYASRTLNYYKNIAFYFDLAVSTLSGGGVAGGVMGLSVWKSGVYLPMVSCAIITGIQIAKPQISKFLPSDKQKGQIFKIQSFYFDQFLEYEKLWLNSIVNSITDAEALKQYHKLKANEKNIMKDISDALDHDIIKIETSSKIETDKYFLTKYKTKK